MERSALRVSSNVCGKLVEDESLKCKALIVAAGAVTIVFLGHARAAVIDTFSFSGVLDTSPNGSRATVSGRFGLNESNGTLGHFAFTTPIGTFTNANSSGSIVTPWSTGPSGKGKPAFEVFIKRSTDTPSGVVLLFKGAPTRFHGGSILATAYSGATAYKSASSLYFTEPPLYTLFDSFISGTALRSGPNKKQSKRDQHNFS